MSLIDKSSIFKRRIQNIPLKLLLIIPSVLLITLAVSLTACLSLASGKKLIQDLSEQIIKRTNQQVNTRLKQYLDTPHLINKLNLNAVKLGQLNTQNLDQVKHQLWEQVQLFDSVTAIVYVDEQGNSRGYVKELGRYFLIMQTDGEGEKNIAYEIDNQGNPQEIFLVRNLDSRQLPWYPIGKIAKKSVWSPIFHWVGYPGAGIATSTPLYNREQQLQGILSIHLKLDNISSFLDDLKPSRNGQIFIIERSGNLVATSSLEIPYSQIDQKFIRLAAIDSKNLLTQKVAEAIKLKFDNFQQIEKTKQITFNHQGENNFIAIAPYQDEYGLDWLVVTIVPENDFMAEINTNRRITLILCLCSFLVAIIIATIVSNLISQPLQNLSMISEAIVEGNLNQHLPEKLPIYELSNLAKSFNQMSDQLRQAFANLAVALEESQAKFNTLFGTSPDPIAIATLNGGRYLEVNESFLEMSGYSRHQVIGKNSRQLNFWTNIQECDRYFQTLKTYGYIYNWELSFRIQSGEIRTLLTSAEVIELYGQRCVIIIGKDITNRKQIETSLRESEQTNRALVTAIPDLLLRLDSYGNYIDIFVGNEFESIHSHRSQKLVNIFNRLPRERIKERMFYVKQALKTGKLQTYEQQIEIEGKIQYEENRITPLNDNQVLVMIRDITNRKLTEAALRRSQSQLQNLASSSPGIIYSLIITPDGANIFEYVNQAIADIFEVKIEDVLKDSTIIFNQFHPEDLPEYIQTLENSTAKLGKFSYQWRIITPSGKLKWIEAKSQPERRENGDICWYGTALDITDRKQVELELAQAKKSAEAANHAKSEFLANMSHELRTPLNAILGFTQLMQRDYTLKSEQRENLDIIIASGEHLLSLINDVLEMSKIEAGKITFNKTNFNLHTLLESIQAMLQLKAREKSIQLNFDLATNLPEYIRTDQGKLRQIILNLLSNSIKFTNQGSVTLKVENQGKNTLKFSVIDTGTGISPQELNHLFHPFVQTESGRHSHQGTGLGLVITRKFVQLMGGDIQVDSIVGKGSNFQFTIRFRSVVPDVVPAKLSTHTIIGLAPEQPYYKIIIADDIDNNRQLLVKLLQPLGFAIREAKNGKEVISLWQEWQPHLIFMDMRMPEINGYEATKIIRQLSQSENKQVIIIALTASVFTEERAKIKTAGCNDMISKPLESQIVFDKLTEFLQVRYIYSEDKIPSPKKINFPLLPAPSAKKILIAEDNIVNQKIVVRILQKLGYSADVVNNGKEAIAALQQQCYHLVLMDMQMPEMDGLEATRQICQHLYPHQRPIIIAMTASEEEENRQSCLQAGMNDYIAKPINIQELQNMLEKYLKTMVDHETVI